MKKILVNCNSNTSQNFNSSFTFIKITSALLFCVIFTLGLINPNIANAQGFGNLTKEHQQFHKFVGEWNQISSFSDLEGKKTQTKGRIVGSVLLSGTLLELKGLQGNQQIITESLIYIGYDQSIEKYYLHGYDRNGGIPNTYLGDYDKNTNKYRFETYMVDVKKGKILSTFEIWFEREDKFIYKVTIHDPGKPIIIAEVANIKVENNSKDENSIENSNKNSKTKQKLKK